MACGSSPAWSSSRSWPRNAVSYGALGTVLIVQSWLIGVGCVVFGGQLFGRWFHGTWLRAWAHRRRGHPEPGGGQSGEQGRESRARSRTQPPIPSAGQLHGEVPDP